MLARRSSAHRRCGRRRRVYRWALVSRLVTIWRSRAGSASARRQRRAVARRRAPAPCPRSAARISVGHLAHGLDDVDRTPVDLELTRLDARDVEQVVDEVDEPVRREQDDVERTRAGARRGPSERASSSTKPLIEVSGLRSSCEAVATNSLFSRSRRARSEMSRIVQTTPSPSRPSRGGDGERAVVAVDDRPRSRAPPRAAAAATRAPCDCPPARARAPAPRARGLTAATVPVVVADDQRVAEALDRHGEPPALGLDALRAPRRGRRPWR